MAIKTPTGSLPYTITHRPRVTKRLHLELDEQGGLVIVAPRHWSSRHISTTLAQNTNHIVAFLARARQRHTKPLLYSHGGQHLFLGQSHRLVLGAGGNRKIRVTKTDAEIHISTRQANADTIRSALQHWYRQQALAVFTERMVYLSRRAPWTKDKSISLKLRRMKRSWGNCSSGGVIKLNTHLIKAPLPIIDSVISHELCHLLEMNHGSRFYTLLQELNPGWRHDRTVLRSTGFIWLQA